MGPQQLAKAAALTRIGFGTATLAAPGPATALFLGRDALTPAASVIGRALGARDALMGGMLLHTAEHPQIGRRWTATCAAIDAVDGIAALLAIRKGLPRAGGYAFAAIALGSALTHASLARRLAAGDASSDPASAATSAPQPASSPETVYPDGSQEAMRSMGARTEGRIPSTD